MNKYICVHSYVFKFSQLPRWSVCMENLLLVRQRKMDRSGFVVRNPVADLSVQKMRAIYFKELSKRGETPMLNSRFAIHIIDLQSFVLSETYRKKATDDLTLRVPTVKIHVPCGCGLMRIKSRNRIAITGSKQS